MENKEISKVNITIAIILFMIFLVGLGILNKKDNKSILGGVSDSPNFFSDSTVLSTSTAVGLPVKVAASNFNRLYGRVTNLGAAPVELFLRTYTTTASATANIATTKGIVIYPATSTQQSYFEINASNLYWGEIWATSTFSGVNLTWTEGI